MALYLLKTVDGSAYWIRQTSLLIEAETEDEAREIAQVHAVSGEAGAAACLGWLNDEASTCRKLHSIPDCPVVARWHPRKKEAGRMVREEVH